MPIIPTSYIVMITLYTAHLNITFSLINNSTEDRFPNTKFIKIKKIAPVLLGIKMQCEYTI